MKGMMIPLRPRPLAITGAALAALLLVGCAASATPHTGTATTEPSGPAESDADTAPGHGAVAGAAEAPEPPLHLVAIDRSGEVAMLDLLDGTETTLDRVRAPQRVTTDGRYAFVADDSGVDVIDSGAWTWDHVDHFHYYRAAAGAPGSIAGDGIATVATGMLATAGGTGLFFPESGEAVLLDNAALASGEIVETLRLDVGPHRGIIAPLGTGAVVSTPDEPRGSAETPAASLRAVDAEGTDLATIDCPAAAGTITTRIAVVVGCADGAVLATASPDGAVDLEKVAYPSGAAAPATEFSARKGRPTVAGLGTDSGVWLLDTRERSWTWVGTAERPIAATAVDDEAERIVTLTPAGAVAVLDATGASLGVSSPLVSGLSTASSASAAEVSLTVDAQRAYVNDPASGDVFEIDYADGARVARTLTPAVDAAFLVETGR